MMAASDFQSMASTIGLKYFHFGMTQAAIADTYTALGAAVAADAATVHDVTITDPAAGLNPGAYPDDLSRDLLLLVNKGRLDLGATAMGSILTNLVSGLFPPANTNAPIISGTPVVGSTLTCSQGGWSAAPTSFLYQWLRAGAPLGGNTTAATRILVTLDVDNMMSCTVTALNGAGEATATAAPIGPVTAT